ERRGGHAPLKVRRAVVLEDVAAPDERTGSRVQTAELTRGSEGIDAALVIGRRRARAIATHRFGKLGIPTVGPQFAACRNVVGRGDLLVAPLFDGERAAVRHDERSV